jgi:hypothetical protein
LCGLVQRNICLHTDADIGDAIAIALSGPSGYYFTASANPAFNTIVPTIDNSCYNRSQSVGPSTRMHHHMQLEQSSATGNQLIPVRLGQIGLQAFQQPCN